MDLSPLIIGAPVAGWAVFSALLLAGVRPVPAGIAGIVWGMAWLLTARFVRPLRQRSGYSRGGWREASASRQRCYRAALAITAMYPIPVYIVSHVLVSMKLMAVAVAFSLVGALALITPALLWWHALRRERDLAGAPILAVELPRTQQLRSSRQTRPVH